MLLKILSYIKGYIKVGINGGFPERFLNLCATADRDIWQVRPEGEGMAFCCGISEYKNLRSAAKRTGVKMRVVEKHGLPFLLRKYRRRFGLPTGAAVFFLLLWFLSGSVCSIKVSGNKTLSQSDVQAMLFEAGIKEGTRVDGIDEENTAQLIILNHPELSWMSINPMGTTLYVDVKERVAPPDKKTAEPQNITALCDGVITEILASSGEALVKPGEAVTKGQVLISGIVTYKDGTTVFRAAEGVVKAQVSSTVRVRENFEKTVTVKTGRKKTKRLIHFFGADIPLYFSYGFENFEKQTEYVPLTVFGEKLPVGVYKTEVFETAEQTFLRNEEQALSEAKSTADGIIAEMAGQSEIFSRTDEVNYDGEGAELTVKFLCEQNIGENQKIDMNFPSDT